MRIIEIIPLENNAHRNQTYCGVIPDGWAIIPEEVEIPSSFPFVNITVENSVVTSMTEGVIPPPPPAHEVEVIEKPTADEVLNVMLGVTI